MGIAPLVFLAHALARAGHRVTVFYGADTAGDMQSALRRAAGIRAGSIRVFTTTLDGSAGLAGIVTDLLTAEPSATALEDVDCIYTCGPEPMMAAVEQFALARHIPGEMSLETALACGSGSVPGMHAVSGRIQEQVPSTPGYAKTVRSSHSGKWN